TVPARRRRNGGKIAVAARCRAATTAARPPPLRTHATAPDAASPAASGAVRALLSGPRPRPRPPAPAPARMQRRPSPRALLASLSLFLAAAIGCDRGGPAPGAAPPAAAAEEAPEVSWRAIVTETSELRSALPRPFRPSGDTVRLRVEVGEP